MGEWSDYFEDFPEENPANQWCDTEGDLLRARVAREAMYSPEVLAEIADRKKRREAEEVASSSGNASKHRRTNGGLCMV